MQALTSIPEISDWTLQVVALRALAEPDAFPVEDRLLRNAAAGAGPMLPATALQRRAEAWRPWRGYAAIHLWGSGPAALHFDAHQQPAHRRAAHA
jgi:AraC family transcriptional regulator, regulatory protein of adaptative response / DNA-3-methyladenine glycosylase II